MTSLSGKNNFIEDILEKAGTIRTLQSFRMITGYVSQGNFAPDLPELLEAEQYLQKFYQSEISLEKQIKKARENTPGRSDAAIKKSQQELQQTRKEYWVVERMWWEFRKNFRPSPFFRGFNLWCSNPRWYLHRVVREDCAGKGGCCGRSCGCCIQRPIRSDRLLGASHCSEKCGCCERARGFKTPDAGVVDGLDEMSKFVRRGSTGNDTGMINVTMKGH